MRACVRRTANGAARLVERVLLVTHPDLLEVLRLEVNIDKLPKFAIQGSLQLQTDSAMQTLKAIHSPAPLAGLYRVPVAPADKRPN